MKHFHCIAFLLFVLLFAGCQRNSDPAFLTSGTHTNIGDARLQKEDFDRSFELLNRLDDSPSLPNTPGYERLVSITDWLNRWIRNQRPDEMWRPDEAFQEIEQAALNAAQTANEIVRTLALLRGETVTNATGQPITPSETLQAERQAMLDRLELLAAQTQELVALANLPGLGRFSQSVHDLQRRFAALENIPNLNATGIRAFAGTLGAEAEAFTAVTAMFEAYALQLKTEGLFFTTSDVEYLKQTTWLRNLSLWTSGDRRVLLEQAIQMCDWVVCNIEMRSSWRPINEQEEMEVQQQHPWQTILLGYGTISDRTAVFLELLRQRRIDAALLAVPSPENPEIPLYWAVGVLLDDEVHVFLLNYGFPIPGPGGVQIGDDGALQFSSVATLTQLMENESLLRQLDVSEERTFPITAEMLQQTTAYLFLMPESVSMRMKVLETELSGEQNMVLYTDPHELRRRFLEAPGISDVELWKYPFRTAFEQRFNPEPTNAAMSIFLLDRPRQGLDASSDRRHYPLWSGRVLHFKGAITGQNNAITMYQNTRVSDREMIGFRADPAFRNNPAIAMHLQWLSIQASQWIGSALFAIDSTNAAKDTLMGIRLSPLNTWRDSTEYLLGRIAEREGRYEDARRHYGNTASSLSGMGNAIRASWLPCD